MSRKCDVCGRGPSFGKAVARLGKNAIHRKVKARTSRRFNINVQSVGALLMCTRCLKSN